MMLSRVCQVRNLNTELIFYDPGIAFSLNLSCALFLKGSNLIPDLSCLFKGF